MEKELTLDGINLHYTVEGSGAPLILMHGWGCDHSTVASVARTASQTNTVYNIDFPGFGKSTEPAEIWGVERYTKLIEDFCKALNIEKPSLAGHSFGGRVAIVYASRNQVDKLILIDAAGVKPRRSLRYYFKVYSFKLSKLIYKALLGSEKAEQRIEKERARRGSSDYRNASPKMRAIMSKVVNEDLCHLMPKISAPTLLIWGENDKATPLSDAKKMERLIPEAGLVSFPECGHYSFLDNPSQFAAVLNSFLKS